MSDKKSFAYVGNWGYDVNAPEHGFGIFAYDRDSGELESIGHAFDDIRIGGPCMHPTKNVLYAPDERAEVLEEGGSQLVAIRLDPDTGAMTEINRVPSFGNAPSYVAVDGSGKYLLSANHAMGGVITCTRRNAEGGFEVFHKYDEANIALFPINEDGSIGPVCDVCVIEGSSILRSQKSSHPHSVMASPDGNVFVVGDLGADRVYAFTIDAEHSRLVKTADWSAVPGSSPRYSAFHPTLPLVFVNNETRPYISTFRYTSAGQLEHVGDWYTLRDCDTPDDKTLISDIRIHPSGKYIYNLVRGYEVISVLQVNESDGSLKVIQTLPVVGEWPKGCAVSPDGRFFYLCAKRSGFTALYSIAEDGTLTYTGKTFPDFNPANVTFFIH